MHNATDALPSQRKAADLHKLLTAFNDTAADYPADRTIVDLFEEQVRRIPEQAAVVSDDGATTYDELNRRANRLSAWLSDHHGIAPGDTVAVALERSELLILSILAILKAGAIYLPIDRNLPAKRIEYLREDSRYKLAIDADFIEQFNAQQTHLPEDNRPRHDRASEVCYIIYTSGTTGLPKGTMIEHHSLVNRLLWMQKQYALGANDTVLQKTSCSFDVSVWELLWWAIAGGKVVFLKDGQEKDPEQIAACIERHQVSVMHFVPSMLAQFLDHLESDAAAVRKLSSLRRVYASGEALTPASNRRFHALLDTAQLVNLYGPTEATIDVTCFECRPGLDLIPIGKPIDNTHVYILDEALEPVSIGAEGRIFLAGAGLARGYLNKPELTAQRFIASPFAPGDRLYDTGDLGRWLPDGNIEYIGRNDDQVKIRGFRIELDEINHHLENIDGVSVAHVLKIDDRLVAFIHFKKGANAGLDDDYEKSLRHALAASLPEYMIPHHFVAIGEVPLSATGKADKKALADHFRNAQETATASATELSGSQRDMADIWAQVLGIAPASIDPAKSFIQHGGDSLSMLKVVALCKKKGYKINIKEFLLSPYLNFFEGKEKKSAEKTTLPQSAPASQSPFVLSPIQQFFFDNNPAGLKFLMHASYYIQPGFSVAAIRQSFDAVVAEHDTLRLRFRQERGLWQQHYDYTSPAYTLEQSAPHETITLKQCLDSALQAIDITKGPLLYARIFFEGGRPVLFIACHHLVMDAVSWKILIGDLQSNYTHEPATVAAQ